MHLQELPALNPSDERRARYTKVANEVQCLLAHFEGPGGTAWMPFPAGSLVPRVESTGSPLLNTHLNKHARAKLALQTEFSGDEIDLFRVSIKCWNAIHPALEVSHPVSMLRTWDELVQQNESREYGPGNQHLAHLDRREAQEKIATAQRRYEDRDTPIKKIHTIDSPFQRNQYGGSCSRKAIQAETDELGAEKVPYLVDANTLKACDKWALLQRFCFKQLHSHHGYIMGKSGTNQLYHRAALGLLMRLSEFYADHELGRTASGLCRPDLVPNFDDDKSFKRWNHRLSTTLLQSATSKRPQTVWPEAFRPATVGHPAVNLQQACETWQQLGYHGNEISAVNRLAHEVACLMTDPWVCNHITWSPEDLERITNAIYEARIKGKNAHAPDPKVDSKGFVERAWGAALIFRHYTRWAGSTWRDLRHAVGKMRTR